MKVLKARVGRRGMSLLPRQVALDTGLLTPHCARCWSMAIENNSSYGQAANAVENGVVGDYSREVFGLYPERPTGRVIAGSLNDLKEAAPAVRQLCDLNGMSLRA